MSRRIVITAVAVLLALGVGIAAGWLLAGQRPGVAPSPAAPPPASTPSAPSTRSPSSPTSEGGHDDHGGESHGGPYSGTDEARRQWEPVVNGFARSFTDVGGGAPGWRKRLDPYVTEAVRRDLATVDPRNLPEGRYEGYEVLRHGETQLATQVNYTEGWAMVLYLVSEGAAWKVYAYDRLEQ